MKKALIIAFIILLAASGILYLLVNRQGDVIHDLESKIHLLQETSVPLLFKITDKKDDEMQVVVKFLDPQNTEIKKESFRIEGNELFFDFVTIKLSDRYVSFPYKIYSNTVAPEHGIKIDQLYAKDDFPLIYYVEDMDKDLKNGLLYLYKAIISGKYKDFEESFGNVVHDIQNIKSFKKGTVYKIITHSKGGIEILEEWQTIK